MILFFTGISFCVLSVLLLIVIFFFPSSYFVIALSQVFILPFIWGALCITIYFLLKKEKNKKGFFIKKCFYLFLAIGLLFQSFSYTLVDTLNDVKAVINDDLYIADGFIIETNIQRKSNNGIKGRGHFSDDYFQHITLDNGEHLSIEVSHKEDYVFELGKKYNITALPISKTVLDFQESD